MSEETKPAAEKTTAKATTTKTTKAKASAPAPADKPASPAETTTDNTGVAGQNAKPATDSNGQAPAGTVQPDAAQATEGTKAATETTATVHDNTGTTVSPADEVTVREMREDIDEVAQVIEALEIQGNTEGLVTVGNVRAVVVSRELVKAVDCLQYAKQWLGKVCEARGYKSPYKQNYKEVKDIVPTADVAKHPGKDWFAGDDVPFAKLNYVSKLTFIRAVIGEQLDVLDTLGAPASRKEAIAQTQVYIALCDARMAIGLEFARLEKNK